MDNILKICRNICMSLMITFLFLAAAGCIDARPVQAASKSSTIYIEGESNYDYAYKVLTLLNKEREAVGAEPLIMNSELLDAAMQRAAEIAIDFSHYRPNGTLCFTLCDIMMGENIAAGQTTPKAVMDSWTKSQGHYENIINEDYQSVGIGVFYNNGIYYWVQCFSTSNQNEIKTQGVTTDTYKVKVKGTLSFRVSPASKTLKKNKTVSLKVYVTNRSYSYFTAQIRSKSLTYKTSNKKIATVSSKGKVQTKKKGTVKITCMLGTKKKTVKIKVK